MQERLRSLHEIFTDVDTSVRQGGRATARVWPTGFAPLDDVLTGGLRAGELTVLGGPQGSGKTTFALQLLRNVAAAGGSAVLFSYELDETNVLERLLVQEAAGLAGSEARTLQGVRAQLAALEGASHSSLATALAALPGLEEARDRVATYGDRLAMHASSSRSTTVEDIRRLVLESVESAQAPVVVVDYLQKVSVASGLDEVERVTRTVEALKDLAIEAQVPIIAIAAANEAGIAPGHRLRVHELRGSAAIAYEADIILLFNNKYDVVAKQHLAYDPRSAERFRQVAVLSLEKNRSGVADQHMEFRQEFDFCRFDPMGNLVAEQLEDGRLRVE